MRINNDENDLLARALRGHNAQPVDSNTIVALSTPVGLGFGNIISVIPGGQIFTLLANGIPSGAKFAVVDVENGPIRFRMDGSNPSATQGHLVNPGDSVMLENGVEIAQALFVSAGGPPATIQVTFWQGGVDQ